ncbi:hypothetical protein TeGR_g3835 [Tetraparma gracilis]|uniref:SOUL heme-binding protein n=1 Tax=Tetraparma gracilis TaxID=2962635 RepID=A0ABQ6MPS3_9STRA|nr:hypothetical protein TeGR_g3835 [Tetraparma gracilis]
MSNIFSPTSSPSLPGPPYTVLSSTSSYEIRSYSPYSAASTTLTAPGESFEMDDLAAAGAAFNSLAAYIFGANERKEIMEMTSPVLTTSAGEMLFYVGDGAPGDYPAPAASDDPAAPPSPLPPRGGVSVLPVPAATLAVARFPGFATAGEVARRREALLAALAGDGVEADARHGGRVPYVVLQYDPPYTLPVVRRNEVGIPVRWGEGKGEEEEWITELEGPSDTE